MKLLLLTFLLASRAFAQPGMNETLKMSKPQYMLNEVLQFHTHIFRSRMIPTMSCSCGNTNFYYRIYKLEGKEWILAVDYSEHPASKMCDCKSSPAAIENNKNYKINGLMQPGKYLMEIGAVESAVKSGVFEVR